MSLVLYDRVRETSTVLGTSDAVLLGAVTGYQSFSVVGNGNTCYYTIADSLGNWEVGLGTYSTTGPTLARTTVYSSSNSNTKVSFPAGTKDVFLTYPSSKAVELDTSGNVSPLGTVASGTWQGTAVTTTYGGTGLSSYTAGDLPYYSTGTALSKLGIGTNGQVLKSTGTAPSWVDQSTLAVTSISFGTTGLTPATSTQGSVTVAGTLATANGGTNLTTFNANGAVYASSSSVLTTGTLPTTGGGTGLSSYTAGDLPYYATGTTLSKLGIGSNTYLMTSTGTAPQWTNPSSVTVGTATSATTATNLAGGAASQIPYQTGSGATSFIANGTTGQLLVSNGASAPTWQTVNAGASLSNDTSTASFEYPLFAAATTGTPTTIYTSNANYLYKPSTGELQSVSLMASNGIVCNSQTVATSYTLPSGYNGMSAGQITVNSGVTVTVPSGATWTVV